MGKINSCPCHVANEKHSGSHLPNHSVPSNNNPDPHLVAKMVLGNRSHNVTISYLDRLHKIYIDKLGYVIPFDGLTNLQSRMETTT